MIGLMILLFFGFYLAFLIWATKATVNWAKRNDRSPWRWGGLAAFVMYNLVFWDWIPTLIAHKYYCDTQAGFTVYQTPEQWKAENPELTAEDLKTYGEKIYVGKMRWSFPNKPFEDNPQRRAAMINKRIYLDGDIERGVLGIIPIRKLTEFIADTKNDEKLAQQVTFGSGYGNPMVGGGLQGFKGWLASDNCSGLTAGDEADRTGYSDFIEKIVNLGKQYD